MKEIKGNHLILDVECVEEEKGKLMDEKLIRNILLDILELINMNKLIDPIVVRGSSYNPGLTGVVVMDTSNIVLHTFLDSNKFSLDIFSVKDINVEEVTSYLRRFFKFNIIRKNLIERL